MNVRTLLTSLSTVIIIILLTCNSCSESSQTTTSTLPSMPTSFITQSNNANTTHNPHSIPLHFKPVYIEILPDISKIIVGGNQLYTTLAYDVNGESIDITSETDFSIEDGANGSWVFNNYISENIGTWRVSGLYIDPYDGCEWWSDSATLIVEK